MIARSRSRALLPALVVVTLPFASACTTQGEAADPEAWASTRATEVATPRRLASYEGSPFQSIEDVSPAGTHFVVSHYENGQLALWDIESASVDRWLTDPEIPWDPTWVLEAALSPDGNRAAYHEFDNPSSTWSTRVVDVATGRSRELPRPDGSGYSPPIDWSPDGRHLLVQAARDGTDWLVEYDAESGRSTRLVSGIPATLGLRGELYTPDGERIVYRTPGEDGGGTITWLMDRDLSGRVRFEGIPEGAAVENFSPDGAWVLYETLDRPSPALYRKAFDGQRAHGSALLVQGDRWRAWDIGQDRNGRHYYSIDTGQESVWTASLNEEGRVNSRLTRSESSRHDIRPSFAPDGARMVALRNIEGRGAATRRLVIGLIDGGAEVHVPFEAQVSYISMARWAPDGDALILKVIDDLARYAFYRYDLGSASLDTLRVWSGPGVVAMHDVTPDGRGVVFGFNPGGEAEGLDEEWEMRYLDLETREETILVRTEGRINMPDVSPSGDSVAFVSGDAVAVAPIEGGEPRIVFRHPGINFRASPAWGPDERSLYIRHRLDGEEGHSSVVRIDTRTGAVEELDLGRDDLQIHTVEVSPDGRTLALQGNLAGRTEIWVLEDVYPATSAPTVGGER